MLLSVDSGFFSPPILLCSRKNLVGPRLSCAGRPLQCRVRLFVASSSVYETALAVFSTLDRGSGRTVAGAVAGATDPSCRSGWTTLGSHRSPEPDAGERYIATWGPTGICAYVSLAVPWAGWRAAPATANTSGDSRTTFPGQMSRP